MNNLETVLILSRNYVDTQKRVQPETPITPEILRKNVYAAFKYVFPDGKKSFKYTKNH